MKNMNRKSIMPAIVLAVLLFTTLIPSFHEESYAASGASGNWSSYASSGFDGGRGSEKNPYLISSAAQLAYLASQTNKGENKYSQAYYKLTQNINLSEHYWTPIGTKSKCFYGELDGDGHTIKGLTVKGNVKYAGLFGYIRSDWDFIYPGCVENLNMTGTDIDTTDYAGAIVGDSIGLRIRKCKIKGNIKAKKSAGGVAGVTKNPSFIEIKVNANIVSKGSAGGLTGEWKEGEEGNYMEDCSVQGSIKGKDYVGGMVGQLVNVMDVYEMMESSPLFKFRDIKVNAKVSGRNYVGGFIGKMDWSANWDSYFGPVEWDSPDIFKRINVKGSVTGEKNVGGIFGYDQDHVLENCSFSGKVKGTENTGGLIGRAYNRTPFGERYNTSLSGRITECYATGSVTGKKNTGGLIGNLKSVGRGYTVDRCFFSGKANGRSATGGMLGYAYVAGEFMVENSYVSGSMTGKTDTGGVFGVLDKKYAIASFKTSYVSVAIKGKKGRSGYIFGKPFPDYLSELNDFYYNKTKAKNTPNGMRLTDDELYAPLAVTKSRLGKEKLNGFDYKHTWYKRKASGKHRYFPELRAFAKSKSPAKKAASKGSAQA